MFSFTYGVMVGSFEYFPYKIIRALYKRITNDSQGKIYQRILPTWEENDIRSLINITSKDDIIEKRNKLNRYIWGDNGLPVFKMPDTIENNIVDDRYSNLVNLEKIDKIIVSMGYGFKSIIYHFHPAKNNNKLVIYHQGHAGDGDFIKGKETIQFFLIKGFSVMAFSMPLLGMNSQPVVNFKSFGKIKLINHNYLIFLNPENFSPIKYFLESVIVSLNYIEDNFNFSSISMVGISGGGWTTVLCSAIDPRITRSYPVAGSVPLFLRTYNDIGDYEQYLPELYRIANYLDLYVLGCYGEGRKQLQIL